MPPYRDNTEPSLPSFIYHMTSNEPKAVRPRPCCTRVCRVAARLREEGVDTRIVLIDERGSGCLCATLKTPTVQVRGGL